MLRETTIEKLHAMRLRTMASVWLEQDKSPDTIALPFDERLALIVDAEMLARDNGRLAKNLRDAKLRIADACMEGIDFPRARELEKAVVRTLTTCRWIAEHQTVIITGATGTGKSYIGCALAHQACRKGLRAMYRRVPRLFDELRLARADGSYPRLLARIAKIDVLVLDDFAISPLTDESRRDLLEILEDRYGLRATVITSQLDPETWHDYLADPTVADAICDRVLHGDGHAQERSLLEPVLAAVQPKDVYIADRNFCTLGFLFGIATREGFFVIRQHAHLPIVSEGTLRRRGRTDTGEVFEQTVTLRLDDKKLVVRRVVLRLDSPTRDGDAEMSILTNLPSDVADATTIANLYRRRWTIESLFARVERNLQSELVTLAYPGAALFAFAVALVASNVFAVVHAAMTVAQKTHEHATVAEMPLSDFAIVQEIRSVYGGMNLMLDDKPWRQFQTKPAPQLAKLLLRWAGHVRWAQFRKAVRGPKVTRKRTGFLDTPHVSTARLLGRA